MDTNSSNEIAALKAPSAVTFQSSSSYIKSVSVLFLHLNVDESHKNE